jgi:DNA-binding CsgD family transcriptional regulator
MKLELFNNETVELWKKMSSKSATSRLDIELELYKKLLNFFQVGDYYYFIFNIKNIGFDLVSLQIENVLGYSKSEFTVPLFMDILHPDDRPYFLSFETKTAEFLQQLPIEKIMKYKVRYDFRIKKKNGEYIRVLHQVIIFEHDDEGGIIRSLGVHTDITHLKRDGKPVLSLIGLDGEPSYLDINIKNKEIKSKEILTPREKDVLRLLIEGNLSKEVSCILNISKQTVDRHRKNMLQKNNLNNTSELIGKAIRNGWL